MKAAVCVRSILSAWFFAALVCFGFGSPAYAADTVTESNIYAVVYSTPSRWTHQKMENAQYLSIFLTDSRGYMHGNLAFQRLSQVSKGVSLPAWAEGQFNGFVKKFTNGFPLRVTSSQESKIVIHGGIEATMVTKVLDVNGHTKYVSYSFWRKPGKGDQEELWGYLRQSNFEGTTVIGNDSDLTKILHGGVKFRDLEQAQQ